MSRFARAAALVLATTGLTIAVVSFVVVHAFVAKPGEWSVPVRLGRFGPTIDASVAGLVRAATQPLGVAMLDGRTIATRAGTLHFVRRGDGLAVDCAPCRLRLPGLGDDRIELASVRVTVAGRADRLAGSIASGEIVGSYVAGFDATSMTVDIAFAKAPIAAWYRLFGDRIPEMRTATLAGDASISARLSLPDGAMVAKPVIDGFTVDGLGTERLAGRLPDVACGDRPARARRTTGDFGPWLPRAVVAAEDQRFAEHPGYDIVELAASLSRNATRAGDDPHGASTIPQQLARILFVGSERSVTRKLREMLYAVEMERTLGKARMLTLYLAVAPWGDGLCGAAAAARRDFGVDAAQLGGAQAVWLAAMLHAPDAERARWRARGGIDLRRATWIVDGLPKTNRATRARLVRALAAMAPPPSATVAAAP